MSYHHILVPVDGSPTSLIAVNHAASLAKAFNSKVTLVYALTMILLFQLKSSIVQKSRKITLIKRELRFRAF